MRDFFKGAVKSVKELSADYKYVIIILFLLAMVGFLLWQFYNPLKDFGLNFFTEILGAIVTILVIDRIIKNREEGKYIPQKLAIYEDVRLFMSRYLHFWLSTFKESVPEDDPPNIETFFSENGLGKIWPHLYLDAVPKVTPQRTWWDWLVQSGDDLTKLGDKILQRHSGLLDPIAYRYIHQLTECTFFSSIKLIPTLRAIDINDGFPRPKILQSYSSKPSEDDYQAMIGLYVWCQNTFETLTKHDENLKKVSKYLPATNKLPPPSMIPIDILETEMRKLVDFRANNG